MFDVTVDLFPAWPWIQLVRCPARPCLGWPRTALTHSSPWTPAEGSELHLLTEEFDVLIYTCTGAVPEALVMASAPALRRTPCAPHGDRKDLRHHTGKRRLISLGRHQGGDATNDALRRGCQRTRPLPGQLVLIHGHGISRRAALHAPTAPSGVKRPPTRQDVLAVEAFCQDWSYRDRGDVIWVGLVFRGERAWCVRALD